MTFGLRNAGQTFQRFINEVLGDLDFVFVYLDDILIASSSADEHKQHVRKVFERLQHHGICLNPAKCLFGVETLSFLGFQVSADGIRPLPDRINALVQSYDLRTTSSFPRHHKLLPPIRETFLVASGDHPRLPGQEEEQGHYRLDTGTRKRVREMQGRPCKHDPPRPPQT
ncbi:Reverse transcriptase (RNA-dependent DNA polymerase) [Nesidiocoris tenuis]|uniref:Reverse transcriptase (RNA-dependent DNA polymerase) n=1 Tax=Nesidiocoris tenuis TaxID=355587 RepID=A0ABN7B530_9HEMI|nr:Reverse transcriptase (RNA-dependent DNA polymerase) [Nesidiocoris tenuis]